MPAADSSMHWLRARSFREGMGLSDAEVAAFEEYFYHITAARGSGEHALRHLLAPFARAKHPLEGRLHDLTARAPPACAVLGVLYIYISIGGVCSQLNVYQLQRVAPGPAAGACQNHKAAATHVCTHSCHPRPLFAAAWSRCIHPA